jgi:hypothetical protein
VEAAAAIDNITITCSGGQQQAGAAATRRNVRGERRDSTESAVPLKSDVRQR